MEVDIPQGKGAGGCGTSKDEGEDKGSFKPALARKEEKAKDVHGDKRGERRGHSQMGFKGAGQNEGWGNKDAAHARSAHKEADEKADEDKGKAEHIEGVGFDEGQGKGETAGESSSLRKGALEDALRNLVERLWKKVRSKKRCALSHGQSAV